jgi:hypothetical protein
MAKRYILLPDSAFQSLIAKRRDEPVEIPPPKLEVVQYQDSRGNEFSSIIDLLPKNIKSKASLLLSSVKHDLNLDGQNRVLFGTTVGQHLYDYLKFFCTSAHFSPPMPRYTSKFAEIMIRNSVPQGALGANRVLKQTSTKQNTTKESKWVKIY